LYAVSAYTQPKLAGTLSYSGLNEGGSLFKLDMPGVSPGITHFFNNTSPHQPAGGLTAGDADWLYGMVTYASPGTSGGLYRIKRDASGFTLLHTLTNIAGAGTVPYYHTDGNIYFSNEYQVKKLDPVTLAVTDINLPAAIYMKDLLIDAADWIYVLAFGTTLAKIKTDGTQWTDLHTFNSATEGTYGIAGVTEIPGDSLFGIQTYGGTSDGGTIYSIKKDGTGFMVHHQFDNATGTYPVSKLAYFDGKLFGTTTQGGNFGNGVLYTINTDGTGYRVLHHFETGDFAAGSVSGNISITSNGRIFGSFNQFYVVNFNYSRFFKVDTSGQNFEPFHGVDQRENGHNNQSILLLNDETIFFATSEMGRYDGGVINVTDTSGVSGASLYHLGYSADGFRPAEGLIKASDGKLYGTTDIGGVRGNGTVFAVNTDGTAFTKLHEFTDAEGFDPSGKLLEASDGKLYGTCYYGGPINTGCIYRINKNGSNFEIVYNFHDLNTGYWPSGSLIEDASGVLYGTTFAIVGASGTVFKINKDGTNYTVLRVLDNIAMHYPYSGLSMAGDYLYGSCGYGGPLNKGGIFRIKKDGTGYEELHLFNVLPNDGESPRTTPFIASNGKLYGTTYFGGNDNYGIIYSMDITGSNYAILKSFQDTTDGSYPTALIQASDGLLYGATYRSNISPGGAGSVFRLSLDGSGFAIVKEFRPDTEGSSVTSLLDLEGNFVLPVSWLSFNAIQGDQKVLLSWKTAQEQNSNRFEVERSANGVVFSKIGVVAAAGNTNSITSYSFTDTHSLDGISYYRLRQVDNDGKYDFSKVVSVNRRSGNKIVIAPNPVNGRLNIQLPSANEYTTLSILDASGKLVMKKTITGSGGRLELDVHHLVKGWYLLQLAGKETDQQVFLKQ
jgi:uncharacterized repeat protein (TIGR03803 family)